MAPRQYALGQRAPAVAARRERIIEAATTLFSERGIAATSMQEVARQADVAPGTVLNHFATPTLLAEAVIERILEQLVLPDAEVIERARGQTARIRALVGELFAFYDRSTPWFQMFRGELSTLPVLRDAEARFWRSIEPLYGAAFGSALDDRLVRGAVRGLTNPAVLGALRDGGLSTRQAAALVGDLLARTAGPRRMKGDA